LNTEGKWFIDAIINGEEVRFKITDRKDESQAKSRTGPKIQKTMLEPQKGSTESGGSYRISYSVLEDRFDENSEPWKGYLKIKLDR